MILSLSEDKLIEYIVKQLNNFFPDKEIELNQDWNIALVLLKIQLIIKKVLSLLIIYIQINIYNLYIFGQIPIGEWDMMKIFQRN